MMFAHYDKASTASTSGEVTVVVVAVAKAMTCVRVVFNLGHAWSMHVRPAHDTH